MPFPRVNRFGIVENPLIETPFISDNDEEIEPNPVGAFLLLNGMAFGLLGGGDLTLL